MLRLVVDAPGVPATVVRGEPFTVKVLLRNESGAVMAAGPAARLSARLQVSLMRDEFTPVKGPVALLSVQDEDNAAAAAATMKKRSPATLATEARLRLTIVRGCTKEHYGGADHTEQCLHRMKRPVLVRFALLAPSPSSSPSTTALPVITDRFAVVEPAAAQQPACSYLTLQRRVHTFGVGQVVTCERPTAVIDGFSHVVWDAAFLLVKYLEQQQQQRQQQRNVIIQRGGKTTAVELGAGAALVGIVAACMGARVISTDLPEALDLTELNVASNAALLNACSRSSSSGGGSIHIAPLSWDSDADAVALAVDKALSPHHNIKTAPVDLVLASDVVYHVRFLRIISFLIC